ncbi:MAG: DUF1080 domain-containing protein, partial [Mariniblastus sp.]|nr:DUF1080 domain-containing protein [Mariniblastus sp.]
LLTILGQASLATQSEEFNAQADIITLLSEDELADGWISLFDGHSLYGWKAVTTANWKVVNGEIHVSEGKPGLLRTTSQFDDFELTLEFKSDSRTNSGVFIRTSPSPKNPAVDCYEVNIASPLVSEYSTGALVGRAKTELKVEPNTWHRFRIRCDGERIQVWIDDQKAVEYVDPKPLGRGYIGLQLNSGKIAFRDISLKPINTEALFDGTNLSQWKTDQKLKSKFEITEQNEIQILGGKGQIESKKLFGDFVFSMQCKTNEKGLNSGVFYRCIPGDLMNGYESQIQNQFKNGKRTDPVDTGTGGIFRRSQARRINSNDNQWFTKTIIATGPHVSVWVNGYQVTDWTDNRSKNPNPRKGLRLQKGSLIFQGHDPTTNILLKNIRAKELSARQPVRSK